MSKMYRTSIILGGWPIVAGIIIFCFWYFTMMNIFERLGAIVFLGGVVSVVAGAICLISYLTQRSFEGLKSGELWKKSLLSGGLLISNFLVAFIIFAAVLNLHSTNIVTICNNSSTVIDNITITSPGFQVNTGVIKPGKKISRRIRYKGDGALQFSALQNEVEYNGVIEGYMIGGNKYVLTVNSVDEFEVRKL